MIPDFGEHTLEPLLAALASWLDKLPKRLILWAVVAGLWALIAEISADACILIAAYSLVFIQLLQGFVALLAPKIFGGEKKSKPEVPTKQQSLWTIGVVLLLLCVGHVTAYFFTIHAQVRSHGLSSTSSEVFICRGSHRFHQLSVNTYAGKVTNWCLGTGIFAEELPARAGCTSYFEGPGYLEKPRLGHLSWMFVAGPGLCGEVPAETEVPAEVPTKVGASTTTGPTPGTITNVTRQRLFVLERHLAAPSSCEEIYGV